MQNPTIGIQCVEGVTEGYVKDFVSAISTSDLDVLVDRKPDSVQLFACTEWMMPTTVIVGITAIYFSEFIKEAGKEHYQKLKIALSTLTNETMRTPRIEPTLSASSEGKLNSNNPYSMAMSVYAQGSDGEQFKLLIPKPSEGVSYDVVINQFLEFLNDYHAGVKNTESIGFDDRAQPLGGVILVAMNPETHMIEWVDHVPKDAREKLKEIHRV